MSCSTSLLELDKTIDQLTKDDLYLKSYGDHIRHHHGSNPQTFLAPVFAGPDSRGHGTGVRGSRTIIDHLGPM